MQSALFKNPIHKMNYANNLKVQKCLLNVIKSDVLSDYHNLPYFTVSLHYCNPDTSINMKIIINKNENKRMLDYVSQLIQVNWGIFPSHPNGKKYSNSTLVLHLTYALF